jgi:hypothetical protein
MPSLTSLVVLSAGLCGAAWGWRIGTKRLYRRSIFNDDDDRGERGWRRRLRQRYVTTIGYALLSALVVLIVMMTVRR